GLKRFKLSKVVTNVLLALIILPITIHHFFDAMILAGGLGIFIDEILIQAIGNIGTSIVLITIISLNIIISFKINSKHFLILNKLKLKGFTLRKNIKVETKDTEQISDENTNIIEEVKEENISETKTENQIEIKEKEDELIDDIGLEVISNKNEGSLSKSEIEKKLKELGDFDPTLELSKFKMPTMNLLNDHGENKIEVDKSELEKNKNKIVETLGHYNIGITSISATVGPTITLYEIVPEAGVRISKIKNLEDDISLSLAAEGIRIIAPIPGKGTIGIEVPNANKNTVSMLEVLQSEKFQNSKMELPIAFGKTISNETFIVDLAKMPHLLMAGATGQGKSVGLNAMLVSLLYKKHPSQIKFVLVDPKKVELTLFNKIERHYLAKLPDSEDAIITDTKKVVNTVNSLCIEMDERYELCKNANCRNIKEYNAKFISRKLNPNDGHRFLPYIVLVIDEFADLIMTAGKEIETPIARLAQLARAIGIHLIVATQRPSVNVITGIIKANFPARVAFRVTSTIDSRTIMDTKGAEQLIGMGDMLISTGNDLTRLQCAFIDTPEVEKICEYIGSQRAYPQAHMLPEFEGEADAVGSKADLNELDSMFNEAASVLVKHQSGSTSLIQRKLRLGYNRAGSIIDQLEAAGIVGPFEGSKARKVLVKDEIALQEILENLNNE
ncbi:MAG: DNA translocase FtsK, partial [Flavobacteriales bacterium]|nr:DNA translocase FtsK [Flavobacteriales bacterium]